jgi:ketosteroid isomerase-like protein
MNPIDLVKNYYAAFDTHDFAKARALMRDDFRFSGPMMQAESPEELFDKMKGFDCDFQNHVLQVVGNGETVGALVDCAFSRPFRATVRMSEWFTIASGKIASSVLVYDTRQMPLPAAS